MEAGLQSLKLLQQPNFYQNLQNKTDFLLDPIKEYIKKNQLNACIQNLGSMFTLFFGKQKVRNLEDARECDQTLFAHFFRTMFDQGIYISPSQHEALFISAAHEEEHLERTQKAILDFLKTNMI
ncbi:MAG: aspartate aminotransferase family protein, partial [Parachlamydiaceae bacterium]|nr:aspartate aminotransferase family protein [Parachlamydiaceae bacterium]